MSQYKRSYITRIPATTTRTQVPLPLVNSNSPVLLTWVSIGEYSTTDIVLRLTLRRDSVDYIVAYLARTADNTVSHLDLNIVVMPDDELFAEMVTAVTSAVTDICITYEALEPESVWNGG